MEAATTADSATATYTAATRPPRVPPVGTCERRPPHEVERLCGRLNQFLDVFEPVTRRAIPLAFKMAMEDLDRVEKEARVATSMSTFAEMLKAMVKNDSRKAAAVREALAQAVSQADASKKGCDASGGAGAAAASTAAAAAPDDSDDDDVE